MTFPDALGYDAWRDELAVPDPFDPDWLPAVTHGPVQPPDIPACPLAGIPSSHTAQADPGAGRTSAVAPGPTPLRAWARADHHKP